jgi:hypothetical protein
LRAGSFRAVEVVELPAPGPAAAAPGCPATGPGPAGPAEGPH